MKSIRDNNKLNSSSLEIENYFEFDDKAREKLDIVMVIALFDIMYKQNKISKKEYDSIISNIHRTYHIKK